MSKAGFDSHDLETSTLRIPIRVQHTFRLESFQEKYGRNLLNNLGSSTLLSKESLEVTK
jgi:hypothetical protein